MEGGGNRRKEVGKSGGKDCMVKLTTVKHSHVFNVQLIYFISLGS